jgi:hypothetical protein
MVSSSHMCYTSLIWSFWSSSQRQINWKSNLKAAYYFVMFYWINEGYARMQQFPLAHTKVESVKTLLCSNLLVAGWEGRWRVSNYLASSLTRNKGVKFSEAYCVWFAFCREYGSHTLDIGSHLQVSRCCLHHNLFTRTRIQKIRSVYTEQTTLALNNICPPNWPLSEVWSSKRYRQKVILLLSTWFLVRSLLFSIQHLPCSVSFQCHVWR